MYDTFNWYSTATLILQPADFPESEYPNALEFLNQRGVKI